MARTKVTLYTTAYRLNHWLLTRRNRMRYYAAMISYTVKGA